MTIVYFTASWCRPCYKFGPVLKRVAAELGLDLTVADIDANGPLAARHGIQAVPTVLVIGPEHNVVERFGAVSETEIRRRLEPWAG